jgi:hypothetical protein
MVQNIFFLTEWVTSGWMIIDALIFRVLYLKSWQQIFFAEQSLSVQCFQEVLCIGQIRLSEEVVIYSKGKPKCRFAKELDKAINRAANFGLSAVGW